MNSMISSSEEILTLVYATETMVSKDQVYFKEQNSNHDSCCSYKERNDNQRVW